MREVLEEFKSRGLRLGVVTGRGRKGTDYILAHHGLGEFFEVVITHDEVDSSKPSPEGILKALRALELDAATTPYVGDMWVDVRAAHRAGSPAISVMWDPAYDKELVEQERPHFYAAKPEELLKWGPARG